MSPILLKNTIPTFNIDKSPSNISIESVVIDEKYNKEYSIWKDNHINHNKSIKKSDSNFSLQKLEKLQEIRNTIDQCDSLDEDILKKVEIDIEQNIKDECIRLRNKFNSISSPKLLPNINSFRIYDNNEENDSDDNNIQLIEEVQFDTQFKKWLSIESQLMNLINEWIKYKHTKKEYMVKVRKILDDCIHGQDDAKKHIERFIAQWINGKMEGHVFGFQGPPGVGKTTLAKKGLAQCLLDENGESRPFAFIPLGGATNGSFIDGHGYTYVGSTWGRIIDIIIESKCMNPIIYIDELDKVSKTEHGREIISILTHLTDPSQNKEYTDKYFQGIKFDLSKALFVFSYNDPELIDGILRDRITEVVTKSITKKEKIYIVNEFILPEILEMVGYNKGDISIENDEIQYIIESYTYEAGVRKLKEKLLEIVREINLKRILNEEEIALPFTISIDFIKKLFSDKPKVHYKKIAKNPHIGLVNGLYATSAGTGGITIIEVMKTPSDTKLSLELTGQQGDVMKESMKCAKTIAWNLLPDEVKKTISKDFETCGSYGLHIHCPEASTPKDGPSAGAAITTAILSRLCNIQIKNTIAMTGEIDLNGKIHRIGGLEFKLDGAKRAGVKKVLIPKENEEDYNIILNNMTNNEKDIFLDDFEIIQVDNIMEVIKISLVENKLNFNSNYVDN